MIDDKIGGPNFGFVDNGKNILILDGDYKDTIYSYEEVNIEDSISFLVKPKAFYYKGDYINLDSVNISKEEVKIFINDVAINVLKHILKMHYIASIPNSDIVIK